MHRGLTGYWFKVNKLKFILKREWLESASVWQDAASRWAKNKSHSPEEVAHNVAAYTKWEESAKKNATTAPVKIVLHFEDGTTETIE
jgi:hypothetical protein